MRFAGVLLALGVAACGGREAGGGAIDAATDSPPSCASVGGVCAGGAAPCNPVLAGFCSLELGPAACCPLDAVLSVASDAAGLARGAGEVFDASQQNPFVMTDASGTTQANPFETTDGAVCGAGEIVCSDACHPELPSYCTTWCPPPCMR